MSQLIDTTEARRLREDGWPQIAIAAQFGVSETAVRYATDDAYRQAHKQRNAEWQKERYRSDPAWRRRFRDAQNRRRRRARAEARRERRRQAIRTLHNVGHSQREIAEMVGCSVDTVRDDLRKTGGML